MTKKDQIKILNKKIEVVNSKIDLSLKAISIMPLFIAAPNDRKPQKMWKNAVKEWEEIDKQYKEILKYENNNDTSSVENQVS